MVAREPAPEKHHAKDVRTLRIAVVTVSDTRTLDDDEGGAIAAELLASAAHEIAWRAIVKDDRPMIVAAMQRAIDEDLDAIVLTGGTGIAPRDVTYEAVSAVLEKTLDGFGEAFRRLSWDEVGARSVLSRAVAGTLRRTFVAALPGSSKAVRLAVTQLLLPLLPHTAGLLRG